MRTISRSFLLMLCLVFMSHGLIAQQHFLKLTGAVSKPGTSFKPFSFQSYKTIQGHRLGLTWEYIPRDAKGWNIETGLEYRRTSLSDRVNRSLAFEEGGMPNQEGLIENGLVYSFRTPVAVYEQSVDVLYSPNWDAFADGLSWGGQFDWQENIYRLSIPVLLGYESGSKLKLSLKMGLAYSYLLKTETKLGKDGFPDSWKVYLDSTGDLNLLNLPSDDYALTVNYTERMASENDIASHQLLCLAKAGLSWKLNTRSKCFILGTYTTDLTSFSKNDFETFYINAFGLEAGIAFKFKRPS